MAMYADQGVKSWDFFHSPLSTHILEPTFHDDRMLDVKKLETTPFVQSLGLKWLAYANQHGEVKGNATNYPWRIRFVTADAVLKRFPDNYTQYFTEQLGSLPENTHLWNVYAI
jgi:hypothetical protein